MTDMHVSNSEKSLNTRRRLAESGAAIGMVLIGVSMLWPLLNMLDVSLLDSLRWVFAAGALLYWASRCVPVAAPGESVRLRRLRRMEFWCGACFGVATFFWFYNTSRYGDLPYTGALMILRDTILFTLAGAVLQLVAAWMIYYRARREAREEKK